MKRYELLSNPQEILIFIFIWEVNEGGMKMCEEAKKDIKIAYLTIKKSLFIYLFLFTCVSLNEGRVRVKTMEKRTVQFFWEFYIPWGCFKFSTLSHFY